MIRTLIADRDSIARCGVHAVLGKGGISLDVDEAASSAELASCLAARYYELIVIDPSLCGGLPAACVAALREDAPGAAVLVFTRLDELAYGVEAVRHGAKGYVMKNCSPAQLVTAVCRVAAGKPYFSPALAAEFATGVRRYDNRIKPHEALSLREFQVFSMTVCGMTTVESADVLKVNVEKISAVKAGVMAKLGAASAGAVADYAAAHGLLADCRVTSSQLWMERYAMDHSARSLAPVA